ncbi:MAG TPA: helix-turn-helix domain-containing protein [Candidatus Aminicenantes bacterium]|nr:helix-turn-helix domain-containing protein [Candidatus Aminicenantes bacterium]
MGRTVPESGGAGFRTRIESAERGELLRLLREHGGNKTKAARAAGLSYQGFLKKLKRLGIGGPEGGTGQ